MKICLVLIDYCYLCYLVDFDFIEGGLCLDLVVEFFLGGELGFVIVVGDLINSFLF